MSSSTALRALSGYRRLFRARKKLFAGDIRALTESRFAIRAEFDKNRSVSGPPEHIEGLFKMIDEAEDMIEMMDLTKAETILLKMYKEDPTCVPVLNVLAHMYGRHLSDFESAIKFYNLVLDIEPDNAWARDERRKYSRYLSYD